MLFVRFSILVASAACFCALSSLLFCSMLFKMCSILWACISKGEQRAIITKIRFILFLLFLLSEEARIRSALELAQELDADYLGLLRRAALARPWHKEALEGASLGALELELHVTAKLQRSYDAAR